MKSKLSTDILSRGSDSLFMRVEEGRFSLCEWKGLYPEHVAQRFQKALFDEDIVVFPATSLKKYVPRIGLYSGSFDREALLRECRPMRRREAEEDRAVIQLVSVFVVRFQDKYLISYLQENEATARVAIAWLLFACIWRAFEPGRLKAPFEYL
jgi:hypothetical protein